MRQLCVAILTGGAVLLSACSGQQDVAAVEPASDPVPLLVFEGPSGLAVESEQAALAVVEARRVAAEAAAMEAQRQAEAAAEAQRQADDEARAAASAAARAAEASDAEVLPEVEECIGYGCSPEQDAEINEGERAANDDYGPGCGYELCGEPGFGLRQVP